MSGPSPSSNRERPVALIGPPGAGKTEVGRVLARRLQRAFVDLDQAIADDAGVSASACLDRDGLASFREREAAIFERVAASGDPSVIALGAGATEHLQSRRLLQDRTFTVLLQVSAEQALARLKEATDRPLLRGENRLNRYLSLEEGRAVRREALAALQVSTDARSPENVAAEIVQTIEHGRWTLPPPLPALPSDVEVLVDRAALHRRLIEGQQGPHLVVVDAGLASAHPWVQEQAGLILDVTGKHKRWAAVEQILDQAVKLPRGGRVIAIGGGALLDVAGLAASLSRRGMRWWAVPTTLLAMVDAGLGGKTAVDHDEGRNLIGAFWPPSRMLVWPGFVDTLPERQRRAGEVEMFKHALLIPGPDDPIPTSLWPDLSEEQRVARIEQNLRFKAAVTKQDPREQGLRRALNLGHTFGHAIEHVAGGKLLHGEAVAHGLRVALRLSQSEAGLEPAFMERAALAIGPYCPPLPPMDQRAVLAALQRDKKATERGIEWVLLPRAGQVQVGPLPDRAVIDAIGPWPVPG